MGDSAFQTDLNQLVTSFFKYLSDEITPANAQDTLQLVLRTEGKGLLEPAQVAKLCNHWAVGQNKKSGIPIYQCLGTTVLRIYQADSFCSLRQFQLEKFIKPFINELYRLCPAEERDIFKEELPNIKRQFLKSLEAETQTAMPEYEVQFHVDDTTQVTEGEWIQITGERFALLMDKLTPVIDDPALAPDARRAQVHELMEEIQKTFTNIIHDQTLKERLIALIEKARLLLNRRHIEAANEILGFVAQTVDQRKDQFLEREVASVLTLSSIDTSFLDEYLRDPERKKILKPLFSNIFETRPTNLLGSLVQEQGAEGRKRLLQFLTVYEPEIFYQIIAELQSQQLTRWYYKRNLIYLLGRLQKPADFPVRDILDMMLAYIHPDVFPALTQEAVRSYLNFDTMGGLQLVLQIATAPHVSDAIRLDKFYKPEVLDEFKSSVLKGAGEFDFSKHTRAVQMILDAIRQELGKATVVMGRVIGGLNPKVVTGLIELLSTTPSRQAEDGLKSVGGDFKIAVVQTAVQQTLEAMARERKTFL